ncbi:MAG: alanine racemase [Rickettsiales bacterium]|nr:alanine racemase [Rickettsiales bacterium]
MFLPRKAVTEINLQALGYNLSQIKSLLQAQTKIMTVVKGNAYGHGAVRIAQELEKIGVDMFGVACVYEVAELRLAGIKTPIISLGATFADDVAAVFEYNYIPTIFSLDIAQKLSQMAVARGKNVDVHIKVETGMGRLGVGFESAAQLVDEVRKMPNINVQGLFTHFADADRPSSDFTNIQLQRFRKVLQELRDLQIKIPLIHAANSAGILFWPESHFDMVRLGKALYGNSPSDDETLKLPVNLKPLIAFKTYIANIQNVPANTPISYGGTFVTQRESRIITLPVGYADGFRRAPKNFGEVLVAGKRVPIVGRVCMDQSMADVTGIEGLQIGDEVVIIGKQGSEEINVRHVAKAIGTSAYEVLTSIAAAARVTKIYFSQDEFE